MSELSEILATAYPEIKVTFSFKGFRSADESKRLELCWTAIMSRNGASESFDYYTGSAWLKVVAPGTGPIKNSVAPTVDRCVYHNGEWYTADAALKRGLVRTKPPEAADLLAGLVSDSDAAHTSFDEWCENFGYDSDSRKALAIYLLCQEDTRKLVRVIGHEALASLRGLEH